MTFKEKQSFRQIWLWILLAAITGFFLYVDIHQLILGYPFGARPAPNAVLVVVTLLLLCLDVMLYSVTLYTEIDTDGIFYRWTPFNRYLIKISWKEIKSVEVIEYEFVGYGWRLTAHYGTVNNISGQHGLQIVLKNGEHILLGTRKIEEMQRMVERARELGLVE